MKTQTGIWIDGTQAIIVTLKDGGTEVKRVESEIETRPTEAGNQGSFMGNQHISNENKLKERKDHQVESYLKKVMDALKTTDELVILGPAGMKTQLKKRIELNANLAPKLKAVYAADNMTENQLVDKVKKLFSN